MEPPGRLLASGRDADIYEYGPGLVLRRSRGGRSLAAEARVMEHLRAHGYPVPAIAELSDDGSDLAMERIAGPSMVEALGRAPWMVRRQGRVLADLHRQLHETEPPEFLDPAPVGVGSRILHLDLHPLNVILSPKGPVVIDWAAACLGDPAVDVALAWILMSAGEIPGGGVKARILGLGRSLLVNSFMAGFNRDDIVTQLRPVVAWKVGDPHMSPSEISAMWRLVEDAEAAAASAVTRPTAKPER